MIRANQAPVVFVGEPQASGRDLRLVYAIRVTADHDHSVQPAIDAAMAEMRDKTRIGATVYVHVQGVRASATLVGYSQSWDFPELQELECPP